MLNNTMKKVLPLAAALSMLGWSAGAVAGPAIGFIYQGETTFSDLWSNSTDSALATGFMPFFTVSSAASQYNARLIGQTKVNAMVENGINVLTNFNTKAPGSRQEITQVYKLDERVLAQTPFTFDSGAKAEFGMPSTQTIDIDPLHSGDQQFAWYYDTYNSSGSTMSNPNSAANYTNGTLIASGHIASNVSSFTANKDGSVGTGSFELTFVFDYVNASYLDIATNNITGFSIAGNTNTPSYYSPSTFWDGTPASSGLALRVDSSLSFTAASVAALPEPSSLALVGVALGGLGLSANMRRRNTKH